MATRAARPTPALREHSTFRSSPFEIIDVDSIDNHQTPGQPNNSVIVLLDSDDDESSNEPARRRRRLVSPPPPRFSPGTGIPPVPPVPREFVGFSSFPRNRIPALVPPVVRPLEQPFDFEINYGRTPSVGPSRRHPNRHRHIPYSPELQPEPRSHHVPALGLGGALISFNRNQMNTQIRQLRERTPRMRAAEPREESGLLHRMRRVFSLDVRVRDIFEDLFASEHPRPYTVRLPDEIGKVYNPEYTHPGKPDSGFAYDFGSEEAERKQSPVVIVVDESPSSSSGKALESSSQANMLLVCARCLEPLVTGTSLSGEERREKKIWALRCGHLIDGKCLNIIGSPHHDVDAANELEAVLSLNPPQPDYKGKGKGRAVEPLHLQNPMRSRLRPRGNLSPQIELLPLSHDQNGHASAVLGKRKRSPKTKSHVAPTFEWTCPVQSCSRLHASIKIGESWVPEPDRKPRTAKGRGGNKWAPGTMESVGRGAVAVFV